MSVQHISHADLHAYAATTGPAGVFTRYVLNNTPNDTSLAVVEDGEIQGIAVSGREFGLYEAYAHWVFVDAASAATALAQSLVADTPAINVSLRYHDQFASVFPAAAISTDRLYMITQSESVIAVTGDLSIQAFDAPRLRQLNIPDELTGMIGAVDDWTLDTPLYGIVTDNTLLCIGEMLVHDTDTVAIQQVYTLDAHRGRGLATVLVAELTRRALKRWPTVIYIAAESNAASCAVAEHIGFTLHSRWAYIR